MKTVFYLAVLLAYMAWATPSQAQVTPRYNCSVNCTVVCDPFPLGGVRPAQTRLYGSVNGGPINVLATANVAAGTAVDPAAPAGSVACWVNAKMAVGTWTLTMTSLDGVGGESTQSAPFVFDSTLGSLPVPSNIHMKAGTLLVP